MLMQAQAQQRSMDRIPIFPLDLVVFPGEMVPLHIFEERYCLMTEEALETGMPIGIALARQDEPVEIVEHAPEDVGTAVKVLASQQLPDGRYLIQAVGVRRFRIQRVLSEKIYQEALVDWLDELEGDPNRARALAHEVLTTIEALGGAISWDDAATRDPIRVSHAIGAALDLDLELKQELLATQDAEKRLEREAEILLEATQ